MIGTLDDKMIDQVLEKNIVGRLGYRDGEKIYVTPVSYLYFSGRYIIVHSREGHKIDILRKNPNVCFEVDEIDDIHNHLGVLVWGKYEEMTDPREKYYVQDLLLRKILKQKTTKIKGPNISLPVTADMILPNNEKKIVYRIRIEERSGRFEKSEEKGNILLKEKPNH